MVLGTSLCLIASTRLEKLRVHIHPVLQTVIKPRYKVCTIGDAYLAVNEPKTQHDDRAPLVQRQPWCFVWIVALKMKTWNWGGRRWTAGCRCNPVTGCRLDQGYQFSLQTSYHVHFCVGLSDTVVFHLCHQFPIVFCIIWRCFDRSLIGHQFLSVPSVRLNQSLPHRYPRVPWFSIFPIKKKKTEQIH